MKIVYGNCGCICQATDEIAFRCTIFKILKSDKHIPFGDIVLKEEQIAAIIMPGILNI